MATVLIVSLVFPPDNVSTAHVMGALASDLHAAGHEVRVVSTTPHYNRDPIAEARQPLDRSLHGLLRASTLNGVPVLHLPMPKKDASVPKRLAAWAGFSTLSVAGGALRGARPDVIIAPSPPLTLGVSAWLLGLLARAPFIYNVQEIYPDVAIKLGALRDPRAITAAYALERFVYERAAAITVIGESMASRLRAKGVPTEKVHVIPNFVDFDEMRVTSKDNPFAREFGLAHRFVVSYAGNMGPAQGLDAFAAAAGLVPDATFALIGDGSAKAELQDRSRASANVVFVPQQPYAVVPEIYGCSDLCLVALGADAAVDALPSKVYRIMACGKPVLACADQGSDLARLVADAGAGWVVPPGNPEAVASAVRAALSDPAEARRRGEAGGAYVRANYQRAHVTAQYGELVERLAKRR